MTKPVAPSTETDVVRALAATVLVGAWIRVVAAIAAGVADVADSAGEPNPNRTIRAGDALLTFGSAGDGVGVLLALAAVAMVWWLRANAVPPGRLWQATTTLLAVTAMSAAVQALGYLLLFAFGPDDVLWSRFLLGVGTAAAYAVIALGASTAMGRLPRPLTVADRSGGDDGGPLVFAIDRRNGDVHSYLSVEEAARRTHVYWVEDDEYAFYTDTGDALVATVEDGEVVLRDTAVNDRETLLSGVREFATRRGISIHEPDSEDPVAYAGPIRDWQALQLWPGWLRWFGRIVRGR